jgi:hypothetical protein
MGWIRSNSPQFVWAIQPRVAVMNNGPCKGGPPAVFDTLRKSPGLQDICQGHLPLLTPMEVNTDERMIANCEPKAECKGSSFKLSVAADCNYTLRPSAMDFLKRTPRNRTQRNRVSIFQASMVLYTIGQYVARSMNCHMRLAIEPDPRTVWGKPSQTCGRAS